MIRMENVSFSYRNKTVVDNITLQIKQGESVAVIGPNGSGKTTLMKLLNGIIYPSRGEYFFDNTPINENRLRDTVFLKQFHKRVGFIFQNSDAQLFCSNVYEEIAFGLRQMNFDDDEIEVRVNDCLRLLNIEKIRDSHPFNISGGEKKRTAIAGVLATNPDVITLDEPMNGIDPKGKKFLKELLIELNKSGKTIICATHDFEYVEGVFQRAVVFSEEHRIVYDGSYDSLIADKEMLRKYNII